VTVRERLTAPDRYTRLWRTVIWLPIAYYVIAVAARLIEGAGRRAFYDLGPYGLSLVTWTLLTVGLALVLRSIERSQRKTP
jgi:hypothetical protein